MEPLHKRQRLYGSISHEFPQSFDSEEAYYDEDDFLVDEGEMEEDAVEDERPDYDADSDFQRKRARLDYKLKSTFESIFEKYERDFDGVGDEIDLATGQIVVNNGHLMEMLDERDAGGSVSPDPLIDDTDESEDLPGTMLNTFEMGDEDDEEDEEEEEEEEIYDEVEGELEEESEQSSDDEMVEDDMILRGFAQANRFARGSPELGTSRKPPVPPFKPPSRPPELARVVKKPVEKRLPTQQEILAQFGPQLGPQIVDYVSKQSVPRTSRVESVLRAPNIPSAQSSNRIEPAWRVPELPGMTQRPREVKKPVKFSPEPARSPSPEEAISIWALPRPRGRGPSNARPSLGPRKVGESSTISRNPLMPSVSRLSNGLNILDQASSPKGAKREKWTEEDDQILSEAVALARRRGVAIKPAFWRELAARHSNHNCQSWKYRHDHHHTYLVPDSTEDSGVSVSEASMESGYEPLLPAVTARLTEAIRFDATLETAQSRPHRVRKPANTNSQILTWTQAVDALESADPDLHADILNQRRPRKSDKLASNHAPTTSLQNDHRTAVPPQVSKPQLRREAVASSSKIAPKDIIDLTESDGYLSDVKASIEQPLLQEKPMMPRTVCPHADCAKSAKMYRLQRRENEELSEMSLHTFRIHHTTRFPCHEVGCTRRGEEGYFMQEDLIRHVKIAHPGDGPWRRLRGRVDSELLEDHLDVDITLSQTPSGIIETKSKAKDMGSDFDHRGSYAQRTNSSQIIHTSDSERTPRGMNLSSGPSYQTPVASISSMKVIPSSGTGVSVDQSNGDDTHLLDHLSMQGQRSAINSSGGLGARGADSTISSLRPQDSDEARKSSEPRYPMPTPATGGSLGPVASRIENTTSAESSTSAEQRLHTSGSASNSGIQTHGTTVDETPDPTSPLALPTFTQIVAPSLPVNGPTSKSVNQQYQRNVLDPTYEFSDEEVLPELPHAHSAKKLQDQVPPSRPVVTSSLMGPPSSTIKKTLNEKITLTTYSKKTPKVTKAVRKQHSSFATPVAQKAVRQSLLRMALDADDFDELSFSKDDVVLISSQPRTRPLTYQPSSVKREGTVDTSSNMPGTSRRKRKFIAFRGSESPDELAVAQASPSIRAGTSFLQPEIKVEVDGSNQTTIPNTYDKGPQHHGSTKASSSRVTPSISGRLAYRTSTPLLNLTPQVPREIQDSAGESSSHSLPNQQHPPRRDKTQRQKVANVSTSPPSNMATPTRGKPTADLLRAEQVTVVVKTPRGTLRSCGDDDFVCGKPFCFRCGSQASIARN